MLVSPTAGGNSDRKVDGCCHVRSLGFTYCAVSVCALAPVVDAEAPVVAAVVATGARDEATSSVAACDVVAADGADADECRPTEPDRREPWLSAVGDAEGKPADGDRRRGWHRVAACASSCAHQSVCALLAAQVSLAARRISGNL